jgi:uncharacterized protein (DUF3084 family)
VEWEVEPFGSRVDANDSTDVPMNAAVDSVPGIRGSAAPFSDECRAVEFTSGSRMKAAFTEGQIRAIVREKLRTAEFRAKELRHDRNVPASESVHLLRPWRDIPQSVRDWPQFLWRCRMAIQTSHHRPPGLTFGRYTPGPRCVPGKGG